MAGAELPAVIVDIMRAGTGLGNIGLEQSDYSQVVKGGGTATTKVSSSPQTQSGEMCDYTMLAFELAFKWRSPVYVLADGVLGQMIEPFTFPEKAVAPVIDKTWAVNGNAKTRQNLVTSIFLDFAQLEDFNNRLQVKYADIERTETRCEQQNTDDADIIWWL